MFSNWSICFEDRFEAQHCCLSPHEIAKKLSDSPWLHSIGARQIEVSLPSLVSFRAPLVLPIRWPPVWFHRVTVEVSVDTCGARWFTTLYLSGPSVGWFVLLLAIVMFAMITIKAPLALLVVFLLYSVAIGVIPSFVGIVRMRRALFRTIGGFVTDPLSQSVKSEPMEAKLL